MENIVQLREALKRCSETAAVEYPHAYGALERVRNILRDLHRETDAIVTGSTDRHGTVTSEERSARSLLIELAQRLQTEIPDSIDEVRDSLTRKKALLSRFTVTLFGRTMVGKSTIREAITRGDGKTIGKGAQRTTRDIRVYEWNQLRIVDTPGIGAYAGDDDQDIARSVIDESDLILFLVSSDGIQESSFREMERLRIQNKSMIFVLNVRRDLTRPIYMRRFIRGPEEYLSNEAIRGHVSRIKKLAVDELGMREQEVKIVPIHAQAAFLATRLEHATSSGALRRASGINELERTLTSDVRRLGPVRRLRTILDDTIVKLIDIAAMLRDQGKLVSRHAEDLKVKFIQLDKGLERYLSRLDGHLARKASEMTHPLRRSVSSFVDDNIEHYDVRYRWKMLVDNTISTTKIKEVLEQVRSEVWRRLEAFHREITLDFEIGQEFEILGPEQYDPFDVKRTLKWTSAGLIGVAGVAGVAGLLGGVGVANFWNPVGWIAGIVSIGTLVFSWFFQDREKLLQRRKASVAEQLRQQIDKLEGNIERYMKEWCTDNITDSIPRFRRETRRFYNGMFDLARVIDTSADSCSKGIDTLNRRLLVRCGLFVGKQSADKRIDRIVRDPGFRTKFTWSPGLAGDPSFCREIGKALEEGVDGLVLAPQRKMVASALSPARVSSDNVYFDNSRTRAIVPLPRSEMGRAIGKAKHNVRLASRLLKIPIYVIDERRWSFMGIRRRA